MIGINKSNITKWINKTVDVPLDNVAPLSYAFSASVPESQRYEKRKLRLKQ